MRTFSLLPLVAAVLLPGTVADAALSSTASESTIPLHLTTALKVPPAKSAARDIEKKKAAPKKAAAKKRAKPGSAIAPPAAEPRLFVPPPADRIVPNGMILSGRAVEPIVPSNDPPTASGILIIPNAATVIRLPPVNPATREAESAQIELAQFLYYDYPLQLRQLDSQIAVTQAEIAALQTRQANYGRFDKFINNANPLFESQQLVNVALVDSEQRLSNLQYERGRIQQWLPVEIRRRQLELHRALAPAPAAPKPSVPYDATFDDDKER